MQAPAVVSSLSALPGGDSVAALMRKHPGAIRGAAALADGSAVVWGPGCHAKALSEVDGPVSHIWVSPPDVGVRAGSRTASAVTLVHAGATPHAAAQAVGINHAAVYRAIERGSRACPCCGKVTSST